VLQSATKSNYGFGCAFRSSTAWPTSGARQADDALDTNDDDDDDHVQTEEGAKRVLRVAKSALARKRQRRCLHSECENCCCFAVQREEECTETAMEGEQRDRENRFIRLKVAPKSTKVQLPALVRPLDFKLTTGSSNKAAIAKVVFPLSANGVVSIERPTNEAKPSFATKITLANEGPNSQGEVAARRESQTHTQKMRS
jgi:hypothetical protein